MKEEMLCGVYCIENINNGKKYIGSSIDIHKRWKSHVYELNNNKHHSFHLQRAWKKHGENSFDFYIIELCNKTDLLKTEQKYIDRFKVCDRKYGYNIEAVAGKTHFDGATLQKIKNGKYKISYQNFIDISYLLSSTDLSLVEISEILSVNYHTIHKIYSREQYKKIFQNISFIERRVNCQYNGHVVITLEQAKEIVTLLQEGLTVLEISNITNIKRQTISDIKNKHSWKELTKDIVFPRPKDMHPNKRKSIVQLDLNLNIIKYYESITDAVNELGLNSNGNIMACLNGRRKSAYGHIWKYA